MDKKSAKKLLLEHKDALETLLKSEGLGDVEAEIEQIKASADEGKKALKKSLLQKVKDFPVVEKISQLGTAGTVAVSTAAVTQADLAKDLTEVFVAEIANDVVEERFEVPDYFDNFIDFHVLNDWGQAIIAEKIEEAQDFVAKAEVSSPPDLEPENSDAADPKQASDDSSDNTSGDTPDEKQENIEQQKPEKTESKAEKETDSSEEIKEDNEPKEEPKQEEVEEAKEESPSSKPSSNSKDVNIPRIETEIIEDDIKPHNQVSPTS